MPQIGCKITNFFTLYILSISINFFMPIKRENLNFDSKADL